MDFSFQPLTRKDFPLVVSWLAKPHVNRWWRDPAPTLTAVEKEFGSDIDGREPTKAYLVLTTTKPIGIIQSYRADDYPKHAKSIQIQNAVGIDLFIGEEDSIGKGYGPVMLTQFIDKIIRNSYPEQESVVGDPEVKNIASVRAFEKAGFYKGRIVSGKFGPEQLMIFKL